VPGGDRKIRPGENHESNVKQSGGQYGAAGYVSFNATIPKHKSKGNGLREMSAFEERRYTAQEILMIAAPGDFQLRLDLARKEDVGRIQFCLTKKVKGVSVERMSGHKL
jgi:hypothetical protein